VYQQKGGGMGEDVNTVHYVQYCRYDGRGLTWQGGAVEQGDLRVLQALLLVFDRAHLGVLIRGSWRTQRQSNVQEEKK
jgi:hypothetical protein